MRERIWAWEYAGAEGNEGQWRSSKGACPSQAYVICEYIRADHVDALLKAEREKALREAAEVAGVKPRRGGKPVSGPHHAGLRDGREEAKRLVLALISKDDTPAAGPLSHDNQAAGPDTLNLWSKVDGS